MSTNYFVVQAQRDLATAQNNELQAVLAYRRSLVELERLQQTTLSSSNITLFAPTPAGGTGGVVGQHEHDRHRRRRRRALTPNAVDALTERDETGIMKRSIIIAAVLVGDRRRRVLLHASRRRGRDRRDADGATATNGGAAGGGGGFGGGGFGGFGGGFGGGPRLPMTVEVGQVKRADLTSQADRRRQSDRRRDGRNGAQGRPAGSSRCTCGSAIRVSRGQKLAKVEDDELLEQIRQAQASYEVSDSDDPPARSRPAAGADQSRSLAQPVRTPVDSAADLRRHRRDAIRRPRPSSISPRRSSRRPARGSTS